MLISEIIKRIEGLAPPCCQASWDKSGLQTASIALEAEHVAVFLDPQPHILEKALARGATFLLSHHPLALKAELPAKLNSWFFALRILLGANACLYAAHTSLDVVADGPAGWLGRSLGLENTQILEAVPQCPGKGYGGIGNLPMPMPFAEVVAEIVKLTKSREAALCGPEADREISRVAWCGGSGGSFLEIAKNMGAQLFVTGDIKYHTALEAALPVLDVGHHALEEEMMRRFANILKEYLPEVRVDFIPSTSPFTRIASGEENDR